MKYIVFFLLLSTVVLGQDQTLEEKALESIDFMELKDVLKDDFLEPTVDNKIQRVEKVQTKRKKITRSKYNYPGPNHFRAFLSEYWLIKNAPILKWDFKKPDYGLKAAVEELFQKLGLYQIKFKILPVNTPVISHFALPGDEGENIYLLSVPFMRALDLSKTEIALLILEDYFRQKLGFISKNIQNDEVNKILGQNFYGKKMNLAPIDTLLKNISTVVFEKGFTFQQQFEVTKKMDQMLKSNPEIWNKYYQLLSKIDKLVKANSLFTDYIKIFPSPEMQQNWLTPKKKVL